MAESSGESAVNVGCGQLPSQAEVLAWAWARWPERCDPTNRALKVGEEAGEVLGAVVRMGEGRSTKDHLSQELAQLVLCAMALAESAEVDLDAAVAREWADIQERKW